MEVRSAIFDIYKSADTLLSLMLKQTMAMEGENPIVSPQEVSKLLADGLPIVLAFLRKEANESVRRQFSLATESSIRFRDQSFCSYLDVVDSIATELLGFLVMATLSRKQNAGRMTAEAMRDPSTVKLDAKAIEKKWELLKSYALTANLTYENLQRLQCDLEKEWYRVIERLPKPKKGIDKLIERKLLHQQLTSFSASKSQLGGTAQTVSQLRSDCGAPDRDSNQPPPTWNTETGELRIGDKLAKTVRNLGRAINVVKVLDVFEEDGWPNRVDDPLDPGKLRDTIKSLNDGLRWMKFKRDGRDSGIVWQYEADGGR